MSFRKVAGVVAVALSLAMAPLAVNAHGNEPHGDHDAHHGGFVVMYKDVHVEVVLQQQGAVQVYYTDGARHDLPASIASDVSVEVERPGKKIEALRMSVSKGGDFWEGKGQPVAGTQGLVHVAFLLQSEPVVFKLPWTSVLWKKTSPAAAKPATKAPAQPATKPQPKPAAADHSGHTGMHEHAQ